MRSISLIAVTLAVLLTGCAPMGHIARDANEAPQGSAIRDYLFSKYMFRQMGAVAKGYDQEFSINCDSRYVIKPQGFVIRKPVVLQNGRAHPTEGTWNYRFDTTRCGATKTYNMLVIAENQKEPKVIPLFPGNSLGSLLLQRDTIPPVVTQLGMEGVDVCEDGPTLFDVSVTKQLHPSCIKSTAATDSKGLVDKTADCIWEENWVFRACSEYYAVGVQFILDGEGGTHILPLSVTKVSP